MNKEILEIAKCLKNKINAGEGVDEYDWQAIIDVCDELLRINSLNPVGYINPVAQICIKRKLNAAIKPNKEDNSIPLYRLDQ